MPAVRRSSPPSSRRCSSPVSFSRATFRQACRDRRRDRPDPCCRGGFAAAAAGRTAGGGGRGGPDPAPLGQQRSEEHTSELQSLMRISYAVFCLKKKK